MLCYPEKGRRKKKLNSGKRQKSQDLGNGTPPFRFGFLSLLLKRNPKTSFCPNRSSPTWSGAMRSQSPISRIPIEILIQILSLLPLLSLHKAKWVSKSWHSLITNQVLPKILKTPFMGCFYRIYDYPTRPKGDIFTCIGTNNTDITIDPTLSFLPRPVKISACYNGLLLCYYERRHYVCNPATKSWDNVGKIDSLSQHISLCFDPWVFPHYRVVTVPVSCRRGVGKFTIDVYRSETRRWVRKRLRRTEESPFPDSGITSHHYAVQHGAEFVYACCLSRLALEGRKGDKWQIVRFGPLRGDFIYHEVIHLPVGTKIPRGYAYIGSSRGKIRFACLDDLHLRVWILSGQYQNQWVMEHNSTIHPMAGHDSRKYSIIVGFHPVLDDVLIFWEGAVFTYSLNEMSLNELCRVGSDAKSDVAASVCPYRPCSSYFFGKSN